MSNDKDMSINKNSMVILPLLLAMLAALSNGFPQPSADPAAVMVPGNCCSPDVIFIIDITDGIGFSRYNCESEIRVFLREIIRRASPEGSCNEIRAAVVEYGTKARIKFDFNKFPTTDKLINGLRHYSTGMSLGSFSNAKAGFAGSKILLSRASRGRRHNNPAFIFWLVNSTPLEPHLVLEYVNNYIKPFTSGISVIAVGDGVEFLRIRPIASNLNYAFNVNFFFTNILTNHF